VTDALVRVRKVAELQHETGTALRLEVDVARSEGLSWQDIAKELGITRTTLWRQYQAGGPIVVIRPYHGETSRYTEDTSR
jgi:predicted DNA-binding protein (UPF0251 family)